VFFQTFKVFKEAANIDITPFLNPAQGFYYEIMKDLNKCYCSVYA
jgi:hypothetical protein